MIDITTIPIEELQRILSATRNHAETCRATCSMADTARCAVDDMIEAELARRDAVSVKELP
jgi:hypothetical protein